MSGSLKPRLLRHVKGIMRKIILSSERSKFNAYKRTNKQTYSAPLTPVLSFSVSAGVFAGCGPPLLGSAFPSLLKGNPLVLTNTKRSAKNSTVAKKPNACTRENKHKQHVRQRSGRGLNHQRGKKRRRRQRRREGQGQGRKGGGRTKGVKKEKQEIKKQKGGRKGEEDVGTDRWWG